MTSWQSYNSLNQEMVDKFTRLAIVTSEEVENAFRCVSRAAFVTKKMLEEAFFDAPIRGSPHIHMSAPHMYASILEDLELEPGMSFLNIGSGTGYFSCLVGHIIKHGINHGVELHDDLVEFSKERVNDFLSNGPPDAKEICPPLLIAGNCFQLDPNQMKYDRFGMSYEKMRKHPTKLLKNILTLIAGIIIYRAHRFLRLYCGGACSQSTITFFLEFLKVGGFLIAPVGTKLIKLERVSHKEGVKTVISDVCFAHLTRLDANDVTKLRNGLLPLLRFPIKTKQHKRKKTIFANTDFPVSSSPARKKLARLRAIQHVLDCLEEDGRIPLPICYVPRLDQMNAYKQYNKVIDCQTPAATQNNNENVTNAFTSDSFSPIHPPNEVSQSSCQSHQTASNSLMTIQEFLLAASPPTVFNEFFGRSRSETSTHNENQDQQASSASRLTSINLNSEVTTSDRLNEGILSILSPQARPSNSDSRYLTSSDKKHGKEFEVGDKIAKDLWEHLCSDKLWESVVDYYYSVCSNTNERRKKCFQLKGIEILNPAAAKLANVLLFKMQSRRSKNRKDESGLSTSKNIFSEHDKQESNDFNIVKEEKPCHTNVKEKSVKVEVEHCLSDLLKKVCSTDENHDSSNILNENLGNILTTESLSSLNNTDDFVQKTSQKTQLKKSKSGYVDIQTDNETSAFLSHIDQEVWTVDHDMQLISFLISHNKEKENLTLKNCAPKVINEDIFDKSKLLRCPLLSSIPQNILAYRSIALKRIAKLLDSVLDILVGPTLERNQFHNPFEERFPLPCFTAASFEVSDSQINVLEAQNYTQSPSIYDNDQTDESVYHEAQTSQDEELLEEVNSMISYELNNVKEQQQILKKKLELIDNIVDQYKEQINLLNQQVDLIEEQQRILLEVNIGCTDQVTTQLTHSQQIVADRKQQRQVLIAKSDKINTNRGYQLSERKELLTMLEQLLSLETRLKNELQTLGKIGMGYLRGEGSNLSNFSQFVRRTENVLNKLKTSNVNMKDVMNHEKIGAVKEDKKKNVKYKSFNRYEPETILARCRFLLPLSKKRYSFVKEMLRTTERSAPRHMPIINVDRRVPIAERHSHEVDSTVFMQVYHSLKKKDLHYRWNKKSYEQWWEVKFTGEGIIDQGGGFRDSLTEMSEELCPADPNVQQSVPFFIKTPNQKSKIGEYLDCYTLNPNCKDFHLYRWLGQLLGACFRTDETLPLFLPPLIWKMIVGEQVYWKKDFRHVDDAAFRNNDGLENLDQDAYIGLNVEQTYSTVLSDSSQIDLVENGSNIVVKCTERSKYALMVRKARMMESCQQIKALRDGLLLVIPEAVLSCLTWKNLERGVCGDPVISIADLKANCRYGDNLKATSECILRMWSALASFTDDERSRFIRFITGRKRLPSPFLVCRSSVDKDSLPSASTCCSNLFLPEYSSIQAAKEKLRYAIYNCVAIDTDTSPW